LKKAGAFVMVSSMSRPRFTGFARIALAFPIGHGRSAVPESSRSFSSVRESGDFYDVHLPPPSSGLYPISAFVRSNSILNEVVSANVSLPLSQVFDYWNQIVQNAIPQRFGNVLMECNRYLAPWLLGSGAYHWVGFFFR
jgi:hypothetical protein